MDKLKARVVARGFSQRKGVDYNETSATVARAASWRILMALAAVYGWHIIQIDFISAYLNGELKERIFMKQFLMLAEFFYEYPEKAKIYGYVKSIIIELL